MSNKLITLSFFTLIFNFPLSAQIKLIDGLNKMIIPIDSNQNLGYSISKESLFNILDGKKIIAIGEATHGSRDFVDLRLSLVKNLVKNLNYKLIVVECDYSSTLALNEYICYEKGSMKTALKSMGFWMFNNNDFIPTVEWLKAYNKTKPENEKVKFYGCDMQAPIIIDDIIAGKTTLNKPLSSDGIESLKILNNFSKTKFSKSDLDKLYKLKFELNLQIQEVSAPEMIINGLKTIIQRIDHKIIGPGKDQNEFRDKAMASNFERIYKQAGECKTILFAHNSHIGKVRNQPGLKVSLGGELNKKYGVSYYALGTTFYRGSVSAVDRDTKKFEVFYVEQNNKKFIEYTFNKLEKNNFLLDFKSTIQNSDIDFWLKKPVSVRNIGAEFSLSKSDDENTSRSIVPCETYDGMIFLKNTNALNL
ncbi:erythromycin esterase family protein [Pedobacter agri]|uniref:erythromycin esterase family protein n=1 Tax=Pedobacter agri TaxID=454586 RepID=UPI00292E3532|nr:erythromycin esterase family protein [Pedobacter agri]